MRRHLITYLLAGLTAGLLSCGEARDDFDLLRGALSPDVPRFHPRANALAAIRPIPPRLEVGFPSRDLSGVMLLETTRNGVETWLTADGATITLEDGLLTSAKGFGSGLAASDVSQSAAVLRGARSGPVTRFHSFLNGNDEIELRAYRCAFQSLGQEEVFVQGLGVNTLKVQENCYGTSSQFSNLYWLRPQSREIVQSLQWTGDFLGSLMMKRVPE